ncbi:MAG TPA: L-threonylcarbamoyladenylate synthase [Fimbriimonadaceae bacterium]|nr:L-threonylcarbamoyladenylate synthase [Fimbriimonadaceae bacterium]
MNATEQAAKILCAGGLVIIPTETVYGLAANALDESAVAKIFEAKGRPEQNPLIVHVYDHEHAQNLVSAWPEIAQRLAEAFWPGPLTMILPKAPNVPDLTTAGLPTVALRAPRHPVARDVLRLSGLALAAPSANRYTRLSPTRFQDLDPELLARVDLALDGGDCEIGIESTVVDLCHGPPKVLRPGLITQSQIEEATQGIANQNLEMETRSPGTVKRHYSPGYKIKLVDRASTAHPALVLIPTNSPDHVLMPSDEHDYAAMLYKVLARFERQGIELLEIERPPDNWSAVLDRLRRASA